MSDRLDSPQSAAPRSLLRRWLPLVAIVLVMALVFVMGWHRQLSFETLARHHGAIQGFILDHRAAAVAVYIAIYIAVVALSLPGGLVLTLTGGILFGGLVGGAAAIVGAGIGA